MNRCRGATLVELVIYMMIVAVLATSAIVLYQPNDIKARYQAEQLRADLRHAQMVALTQNLPLRVIVSGSAYTVSSDCSGGGAALTDPATNNPFSVNIAPLALTGPATTDLDALGRPGTCSGNPCGSCTQSASTATFTVAGGGTTYTITMQPVTGFASVSP